MTTELKRPLNGRNALVTALTSTYRDGDRTISFGRYERDVRNDDRLVAEAL